MMSLRHVVVVELLTVTLTVPSIAHDVDPTVSRSPAASAGADETTHGGAGVRVVVGAGGAVEAGSGTVLRLAAGLRTDVGDSDTAPEPEHAWPMSATATSKRRFR